MSDSQKKGESLHATAPPEEEEIIDLLEEVPEEGDPHTISDVERKLLDVERTAPSTAETHEDLPEIDDMVSPDFLETDAGIDHIRAVAQRLSGFTPAPVFEESALEPDALESEIEEIPEFDEQASAAEDLLDIERILAGPEFEEKEPRPEEDDGLELIDADQDDGDNEIVWFDDLDKETDASETAATAGLLEEEILPADADAGRETSLADIFSADLRAGRADAPIGPEAGTPEAGVVAAAAEAAAVRPLSPPAESASVPYAPGTPPSAPPTLSDEEIDAAVERVIERKLGRTIESVIQKAIEEAVSKEIERLKRLLLDNDQGASS